MLPNRRAGLFLQKYLGKSIGKTIWSPAIFSIEDFIINISGLRICDPVQVLFELYEIHKGLEGQNAQPFDEFTSWAQQLLGDFNEIDSYLVDASDLFTFLNEAKALSIWNLDNKPLTDFEKQYLRFFNSLYTYHEQLEIKAPRFQPCLPWSSVQKYCRTNVIRCLKRCNGRRSYLPDLMH